MLTQFKPLIEKSIKRNFAAGTNVIMQGEKPKYVGIILKGVVRVYNISARGDEQILIYYVPGDFFPCLWVFDQTEVALFFYEAAEDCEIALVSKDDFLNFATQDTNCLRALMRHVAGNYAASLLRITALEQAKARDKLLYTLYYLCCRYGKQTAKRVEIGISLTHQNLAALTGLTRETAATEMNRLKTCKMLTYDHQTYRVNLPVLLDALGEDSFGNIKNIGN